MTKSAQPAVLIIHGAWTPASAFADFSRRLERAGFLVECPQLPSVNIERNAVHFVEEVATVRKALTALADNGHPILVLMHSYGGIVGANAVTEDLYLSTRQKKAKDGFLPAGGVVSLVYVAAMMVQKGQTADLQSSEETKPY